MQMVCGSQTFDLAELKKVTFYDGYKKDDITVQHFWEVRYHFSGCPKISYLKMLLISTWILDFKQHVYWVTINSCSCCAVALAACFEAARLAAMQQQDIMTTQSPYAACKIDFNPNFPLRCWRRTARSCRRSSCCSRRGATAFRWAAPAT